MESRAIKLEDLEKEIRNLKEVKGARLIAITCIDDVKHKTLLYQFDKDGILTIKTKVTEKQIPKSITGIFPSAFVYECEIHDLFDVEFAGNKRLHDKLLLADDFKDKHPLKKNA